jgi:hypothetical protein
MAKKDNPIPEEYRELIGAEADDPAFIAAWVHAAGMNNSNKGCMLYAQNHAHEFASVKHKTPEDIQAEIERLTEQKEALETSAS